MVVLESVSPVADGLRVDRLAEGHLAIPPCGLQELAWAPANQTDRRPTSQSEIRPEECRGTTAVSQHFQKNQYPAPGVAKCPRLESTP